MADDPRISALQLQASACRRLGSPFTAALAEAAAMALGDAGPVDRLLAPWLGLSIRDILAQAAPLRLLGAIHDLALSGEAPALAAVFPAPDRPGEAAAAWRLAHQAMESGESRFAAFMAHEPQTNEPARSGVLLGGFLHIASAAQLPLRCIELGASAGLNLWWDRWRYDLRPATFGPPDAPVRLACRWEGAAPPLTTPIEVRERLACDRAPIHLADPIARRRLEAFVWPDQFDRLARLEAACDAVADFPTAVEACDAVAFAATRAGPQDGVATVVYHSIFWQYLAPQTQAGLTAAIAQLGARARAAAPFAWLRMEPVPDNLARIELRLTLWPGDGDRVLAECHPHGAWANWRSWAPG